MERFVPTGKNPGTAAGFDTRRPWLNSANGTNRSDLVNKDGNPVNDPEA
ncbi:MAG: hypothetical protein ACK4P2_06430 [Hyphomonas sp.]